MQQITERDRPKVGTKSRIIYDALSLDEFRTPKDVATMLGRPEHELYSCYFSDLRKRGLIISQLSKQLRKSGNAYWEHKLATHKQPVPLPKTKKEVVTQNVASDTASAKKQIAAHLAAIEEIIDTLEDRMKTALIEKMFDQL
jgi:hypothetical protein